MWIVMTSAAKMPLTCWGRYRRVAVVRLTPEYAKEHRETGQTPRMISRRAVGVADLRDMGRHSVGKTVRSAYQRTLMEARELARGLNELNT